MAKILVANAGEEPRTLWGDLPLDDAVRIIEPDRRRLSDLSHPPKSVGSRFSAEYGGYQHVFVMVDEHEARLPWKPGFYRSSLGPAEAFFRLRVHKSLGPRWRDEWKKDQDADGDPAIWLWVVLKADAPDSEWAGDNRERIRAEVREAAAESGISDWVFVRFRMEKEGAAVS